MIKWGHAEISTRSQPVEVPRAWSAREHPFQLSQLIFKWFFSMLMCCSNLGL